MNKIKLSLILLSSILMGCSDKPRKVLLIKQWHLAPSQVTLNIDSSKQLPQFENQKDIFLKLSTLIESNKVDAVVSEGCEGEIDKEFNLQFNGFDMKTLEKLRNEHNFSDIMAPVGMKLKIKYPHLKVVCGDNLELIEKNQKSFSDLRGFLGFYQRLKNLKGKNDKKYQAYVNKLKELYPDKDIPSPVRFSLDMAIESLTQFESFIHARNASFYRELVKFNRPALIIGGLHVKDLNHRLVNKGIKTEVYTPKGYNDNEQKLLETVRNNLQKEKEVQVLFNQVPPGFNFKNIKLNNDLEINAIFTKKEYAKINEILPKHYHVALFSDFDGDGIRDFTLSSSGSTIILTAEDTDWDNDGVDNLVDTSLGKQQILPSQSPEIKYKNSYLSQVDAKSVIRGLQKKITLIQDDNIDHEIVILELFKTLLEKEILNTKNIRFLRAAVPRFSYGKNVFFSYIETTKTLEYYPVKLSSFVSTEFKKRFKGANYKQYINSYVIPLIIHSLSHEFAHSIEDDVDSRSLEKDWLWKEEKYTGKYLTKNRLPNKKITIDRYHYSYKGKIFSQWIDDFESYQVLKRNIFKQVTQKERLKLIRTSPYYIKSKTKRAENMLSFLQKHSLPSVYALKNPSELFAERFAMCIFKKVYPRSNSLVRAIELEQLLGINPLAVSKKFCKQFL